MDRKLIAQRRFLVAAREAGVSLVELMVALLIGSLVVLVATQLFITNQRTFVLQQGLTDVQEQGRFALDYITRDLRRMGLRQPEVTGGAEPGIVLTDMTIAGVSYAASSEGGAANTANDRLTFSFHGLAGAEDCEGDALAFADLVVNTYWVNADDQLMCMGSVASGTGGIAIVDGVDSFQVLYGVDTVADGVPFAGRYVQASALSAADEVVTVRIGILVRTTQENLPQLADPLNYVVLDKQLVSGEAPLDTAAVRRLFTSTVRARNLVWERI